MESKLTLYEIAGMALVIVGFIVGIVASALYTWAILNIISSRNSIKFLNLIGWISLSSAVLIYTGFFLIFWNIGKKMKQSIKYSVVVILLLVIVITNLLIWIIAYFLNLLGVELSGTASIVTFVMLPLFFAATLSLLIGIALFMISKNYPQIEKIFK